MFLEAAIQVSLLLRDAFSGAVDHFVTAQF